ncbi:prefoldin subunit 1 isoform X2 [Mobula hypostoma]|uniref:prefoldin subunit 1 isoform X2 n=1 Tax=Mobula hypostoma TaxID=723540 RepID=UPI002FC306B7
MRASSKMAAPVDLELKKAFAELQTKVLDTQQKVKLADLQIEQLNRTKKHAYLTDGEIATMPEDARMYEGVGRMFILQPKAVIHNQLLEKQKIAEQKIKELEFWLQPQKNGARYQVVVRPHHHALPNFWIHFVSELGPLRLTRMGTVAGEFRWWASKRSPIWNVV